MKTSVHSFVSLVIAAALYPIFHWKVLLILAGGVLIDVDHYIWYVLKHKKLSLFGCYNHFVIEAEKNKWRDIIGSLLIFHTVEFLLAVMLLSFYSELALLFAIGLLPHYLLDAIHMYTVPKRLVASISLVSWIAKNIPH